MTCEPGLLRDANDGSRLAPGNVMVDEGSEA